MKRFIIPFIATAVLTGTCTHEDLSKCIFNAPVAFTGNMTQLQTKVSGESWNTGDSVGIYMIKAGTTLSDANIVDSYSNKRYSASLSGAQSGFIPFNLTPMFYPNDGSHVTFLAYHPWSGAITTDFKLPINLNNQSNQSAIDILYAPVTSTSFNNATTVPVLLTFKHVLVKLSFSITHSAGAGGLVGGTITVSIPKQLREGFLDLKNGLVQSSGTQGVVTITSTSGSGTSAVTAEAIVFPGSTSGITFSFLNSAGQLFTASIPSSHPQWDGGYIYTYVITLEDAVAGTATITGTITPWGDGGTYPLTGTEVVP